MAVYCIGRFSLWMNPSSVPDIVFPSMYFFKSGASDFFIVCNIQWVLMNSYNFLVINKTIQPTTDYMNRQTIGTEFILGLF